MLSPAALAALKFSRQVVFEYPTATQNTAGKITHVWSPTLTAWASIQPMSAKLLAVTQARTSTAEATHTVVIRYNPNITSRHRIRYNGAPAVQPQVVSYETMTADDWSTFTSTPAAPPVVATTSKYFAINGSPLDPDMAHQYLVCVCTEVIPAGAP